MAKKIMQDMVMRKERRESRSEKIEREDDSRRDISNNNISNTAKSAGRIFINAQRLIKIPKLKLIYKLAILLFFIVAFIFVLKNLSWVTLRVTPKQEFLNIKTDIEAFGGVDFVKKGDANGDQNVYFELMEVSEEGEKASQSSGIKELEKKANGKIVIYNEYSSIAQALIRRTRFETPDGKIYRIDNQVVVPGTSVKNGSIIPGSVEVTVYADEPGEKYNIGLSDFTIPGFKSEAEKYNKFYARSKTEMVGGFVGKSNIITEDDISSAREALRNEIKESLVKKAEMSVPSGFLYYKDLTMLDFVSDKNNPRTGDGAENFKIKEKGILKAFLIKESDLSNALVSRYLEKGVDVRVVNLKDFSLILSERKKDNDKIVFSAEGFGHFVWNINIEDLKNNFIKSKNNKSEVFFKNYPMQGIEIIFHPSWWRFIPKDGLKVKYEEVLKTGLD